MLLTRPDLIIFDWDGTLMDSIARIVASLQATIEELQLEYRSPDTLKNVIGLGMNEAVNTLFPHFDVALTAQFVHCYRGYYFHRSSVAMTLFQGVPDMLERLRISGYQLAIATSKGRRGLDEILATTDLVKYFVTTRSGDDAPSKPHPDMLLSIVSELGVYPEKVLMVGDSQYDMAMAKNAGVKSIGVLQGIHTCQHLTHHGALACLPTVVDLPQWLSINS